MHKIQKRPVRRHDKSIRPMMYLALSYDHRIVDGREAVSFLVRMKDLIEDPQRIMLDVLCIAGGINAHFAPAQGDGAERMS